MDVRATMGQPAVRWTVIAVGGLLALHLLAILLLLGLQRSHTDAVLSGVEVDGVDVGGLDRTGLGGVIDDRAEERLGQTVRVTTVPAHDVEAPDAAAELETDHAAIGTQIDTTVTGDDAWGRGRRGLWRALGDQLAVRFGRTLQVPLRAELDEHHLDDWSRQAAEELSVTPRDGAIEFIADDDAAGVEVDVTDARPGTKVDPKELRDRTHTQAAGRLGPVHVEVPATHAPPTITSADVEAVLPAAERAVSAPVVLTNPSPIGADLELSPGQLSTVLDIAVTRDEDGAPALEVSSSGEALSELLGDDGIAGLETSPVELEVALVDGSLSVDGGLPGYAWGADATAETVAELARSSDDRTAELPGRTAEPELTAEELEDLGVTEIVSSFTTDLVPGQSRNTNIHLAADYLDSSLVRPGETFSLNQGIGQRTAERGFVENGFIRDGELESLTGGGVSQMGTTFMNAAWFAGVALLDFTPHSLYFSRYPMGREATLSWGTLDVVFENDSPHGIMVLTSHTSSSVTVAFASTPWAEVDTWTGEPYDVEPGSVRNGFTVDFGRDITYPDGSTTSESYTHTYQPED